MAEGAPIVHADDGRIYNMARNPEVTVEDLYHVPENGKAEIVNGELVLMTPAGGLPQPWRRRSAGFRLDPETPLSV